MNTPESRITATDRLRREGRWDEASLYRDEERRRLRAAGKSKAEANESSWAAMLAKFPPVATNSAEPLSMAIKNRAAGDVTSALRDYAWVYEHFGDDSATAEDFPSLGAYGLWTWARKNRDRFCDKAWRNSEAARQDWLPTEEDSSDIALGSDEADHREFWVAGIIEDAPSSIRQLVRNAILFGLSARFVELDPTPYWWGDLGSRLMSIVREDLSRRERRLRATGG